jgi:hypothetical protein
MCAYIVIATHVWHKIIHKQKKNFYYFQSFWKSQMVPTCDKLSIIPTIMILLQILTIMCILCDFSSTIKILKYWI